MKRTALLSLAVAALSRACIQATPLPVRSSPAQRCEHRPAAPADRASELLPVESAVPPGSTVEAWWTPRAPTASTTATTLLIRSATGGAACMFAERVKGAWLTHVVEHFGERVKPGACMSVLRIDGRWVFVREELGGYEGSDRTQVDTSWFELYAVVDGEMRRVFPVGPNWGIREVSSRAELSDAYGFWFARDWDYLAWAADGRSIESLVVRRRRGR